MIVERCSSLVWNMTALNKACPCFTVMIRTPCSRGIWYLSSSWLLSEGPCLLSSDQLLCRSSVGFSRAMFFHISLPGLKLIDQSINHFITSEIQSKWSLELALLAFSLVLVSCPILPKLQWILWLARRDLYYSAWSSLGANALLYLRCVVLVSLSGNVMDAQKERIQSMVWVQRADLSGLPKYSLKLIPIIIQNPRCIRLDEIS